MQIYTMKNYEEMSKQAADLIADQILQNPKTVLGLATGSSPIGTYASLIKRFQENTLDFSAITTFNLDEYLGLDPSNDQSYRFFMEDNLFNHVNIDAKNINFLDGTVSDAQAECARYEKAIQAVDGIDLQLLGIGHNGHIAFNEPSDHFEANTFEVSLTQKTIEANTRFFASEKDVPRKALTMGIRAIMQARKLVVVVSGEDKAEAVRDAITGPITPQVPASILQIHNNISFIGDEAAMSLLKA